MKERDFYDAAWERLVALKSYKLISTRSGPFRLTRRGIEFLKHEDKEFYLGKITLSDKYKRTKYPDIFLECLKVYVSLSEKDRNSIRKIIWRGTKYDYWDDLTDEDWERWFKFVERVREKVPDKSEDTISRVCDASLRSLTVGIKSPIDLSVKTLKRIIKELDEIKKGVEDIEDGEKEIKIIRNVIVENLLEIHLEDLIRRNISKIFPDFEIIDGGRHYYTKNGNYLDILCKDRKDGSLVVIELKRDRLPSKALIQLLDYMNQVMKEFGTEKVKGILVCQKTDRRMESALNAIRKKLKSPNDISLVEFDLKFIAQLW